MQVRSDIEMAQKWQNCQNYKIRNLFNRLELLAHPAGVEPVTPSTANFDSGYAGTDCNKQG